MNRPRRTKLSIKARITLWYALLLLTICALAAAILLGLSEHSAQTYYEDTLRSAAVVLMDEMEIEHGMLEIDSDLEDVPNVYAALFAPDGSLVYGRRRVDAPFEDGALRQMQGTGHSWYIYDTLLTFPDRESLWLRLHMSSDVTSGVYRDVLHYGMWLLPLLALVALLGGYLITARAFRPVKEMTHLASSIADGGDLSRRIGAGGEDTPGDELHALADTLNEMLARLQLSFEHERQFTSDAAHELRTPLNAMRMQGEYALSRSDMEEKDEAVARMLEKSEEMHALVNQLLMIARMDAGQLPLEDVCPLDEMLASIAQDMAPVAKEKDIRIETALMPCAVPGNRAMLSRVFINLIDNAIRYGREGGSVRLSLRAQADAAQIAVQDDGCGLDKEEIVHVFDRFWRSDSARATSGTGVGLAIVASAVRSHGGSVSVVSEAGEGSCFTIRLPK